MCLHAGTTLTEKSPRVVKMKVVQKNVAKFTRNYQGNNCLLKESWEYFNAGVFLGTLRSDSKQLSYGI